MLKIAVDLDDTLVDFTSKLVLLANERFGLDLNLEDYTTTDHYKLWGTSPEVAHLFIEEVALNYLEYEEMASMKDAYNILQLLVKSGLVQFYLVTARDIRLEDDTRLYIERKFPGIFKDVIVCNYYGPGIRRSKTDVCEELSIALAIDDRPDYYSKIPCIVFDRPWNRQAEGSRICTWDALPEELLSYIIPSSLPEKYIIGLSGKLGAGKDTCFEILQKYYPVERRAFADSVKRVVALITNTSFEMNCSREGKQFIAPGRKETLGRLQQKIGQGLRDLVDSNIWVDFVLQDPELPSCLVLTDCRYPSEADAVRQKGGIIIRINGDPADIRALNADGRDLQHSSETALDDYNFDFVIENTGSLSMLEVQILGAMTCYK